MFLCPVRLWFTEGEVPNANAFAAGVALGKTDATDPRCLSLPAKWSWDGMMTPMLKDWDVVNPLFFCSVAGEDADENTEWPDVIAAVEDALSTRPIPFTDFVGTGWPLEQVLAFDANYNRFAFELYISFLTGWYGTRLSRILDEYYTLKAEGGGELPQNHQNWKNQCVKGGLFLTGVALGVVGGIWAYRNLQRKVCRLILK
ncbi:MAG: hypothetical protein LBJ77_01265 [Holosporales bacterium]|nr:hypothetical protein [Holosporales bacterium]